MFLMDRLSQLLMFTLVAFTLSHWRLEVMNYMSYVDSYPLEKGKVSGSCGEQSPLFESCNLLFESSLLWPSGLTYNFQTWEDRRVHPSGNPPGAWGTLHEWSTWGGQRERKYFTRLQRGCGGCYKRAGCLKIHHRMDFHWLEFNSCTFHHHT